MNYYCVDTSFLVLFGLENYFFWGGKMKGLLRLKDLSTEKIQEIINYAEKLKGGFKVSYPGRK